MTVKRATPTNIERFRVSVSDTFDERTTIWRPEDPSTRTVSGRMLADVVRDVVTGPVLFDYPICW